MSLRYLSMSQLADVTGLDRRTVKSRLEGIKEHKKHGKAIIYDAHSVLPHLLGLSQADPQDVNRQLREEQLRYEKARADKIELDMEIIRRDVVPIEDVVRAVEKEYTYVRATLSSIPSRLARTLAVEDDPAVIETKIKEGIDEAMEHMRADTNPEILTTTTSNEETEEADEEEM